MPKICLECLLRYRYNQSWARSSTTENKEICRVSIGHGTNLFNFKRAQNRSSISEYIFRIYNKILDRDWFSACLFVT